MSRTALTFVMLAAAGGCLSRRDPVFDPENPRAVPPGQVRPAPGTWQRPDGVVGGTAAALAPAAPAGSWNAQTRLSSYAPVDPRYGAPRAAAAHPPRPTPAAEPEPEITPTAAGWADDGIDQSLVQATMVVTPRVPRGEARGESPPPPSPPPPPVPDQAAMPLPRIVSGKIAAPEWPAPPAAAAGTPALRLVSSRRINFNFEVRDPVAGAPVVELWGTQDLKSWRKYETIAHPPHTLVAEIREEGLYGFSLLARSGAVPARGPLPGDLPQVWVMVDYTRPVVQLQGAELNLTARVPTLILRWSATDRNLGPRPVTLSFAEQADGPWTPIAANLENTGRHEWVLPATVPPVLHLRVQATDLMGNIGTAQTTSPLYLPRSQPAAAPVVQAERSDRAAPETERPPSAPPRLVTLPPTPITDLPRPAAVEPPHPQVNIVSVEADRN